MTVACSHPVSTRLDSPVTTGVSRRVSGESPGAHDDDARARPLSDADLQLLASVVAARTMEIGSDPDLDELCDEIRRDALDRGRSTAEAARVALRCTKGVELRRHGFTVDDVALRLSCSPRQVKTDWARVCRVRGVELA